MDCETESAGNSARLENEKEVSAINSKKINTQSKVAKSCNSCEGGVSKIKRILKVLRESERPLKPKEIAFFAKVNHSTTRSYLCRLKERDKVEQPYPQVYVAKPTDVMGEDLVRVHNLILGVGAPGLSGGVRTFEGWFGAVKVRVLFGSKRGKITCFASCDEGMDLDKFDFVVDKFKSVILERTGVRVSDGEIKPVTVEINEDNQDVRLDGLGVKCVTVKNLRGFLERIYSKNGGVRSEVKVQPGSLDHIYALFKGGMTPYQILQSVGFLDKKMDQMIDAIKFQTSAVLKAMDQNAKVLEFLKNNDV